MKNLHANNEKASDPYSSSILFRASLGSEVNQTVCADIGADVNLMHQTLLEKGTNEENNFKSGSFSKPVIYKMAAEDANGAPAKIKCYETIVLDMGLHIRHDTLLMLRNLKWYKTTRAVNEPLLGGPVIEALGRNTSEILAAAADQHNGSPDL